MEGKSLGRKQTLTYLRGYANDCEPVLSAGEPRPGPSRDTIAALAFGEARAASPMGESLPKWVENDRKVCGGGERQAAGAAHGLTQQQQTAPEHRRSTAAWARRRRQRSKGAAAASATSLGARMHQRCPGALPPGAALLGLLQGVGC